MDDISNSDSLQTEIHQALNGLFQDFIKARIDVKSQSDYEQIINQLIEEVFEAFKQRYVRIKNSQKYKNIFLSVVRAKQDELFSDKYYLTVEREVREIDDDSDTSQPYFEAIHIYCKRSGREDTSDVINYLIWLSSLLQVFHKINNCRLADLNEL